MIVVVLGMHRSGTSAVAGAIHKMKVPMARTMLQADEWNPWGYYEDLEMVMNNIHLLRLAGGSWWDPPSKERIVASAPILRPDMARAMEERMGQEMWGWKDPRTALTLPAWLRYCKQPLALVRVERDEDAVVKSLLKRHAQDEFWLRRRGDSEWRALVRLYKERLDGYPWPVLRVQYEELIAHPREQVERMAEELNLPVTEEALAHVGG